MTILLSLSKQVYNLLQKTLFTVCLITPCMKEAMASSIANEAVSPISLSHRLIRKNLREIKKISKYIRRNYPESNYHYVTVGRSPTPIEVYLRVTGTPVTNLPLSGGRTLLQVGANELFRTHFKRQVPDPKGKKLLFIDYSVNGGTFYALDRQLEALKSSSDISSDSYEFLVIASKSSADGWLKSFFEGSINAPHQIYKLSSFFGTLAEDTDYRRFVDFSMYEKYYLMINGGVEPTYNKNHQIFVNEMRKLVSMPLPSCRALVY